MPESNNHVNGIVLVSEEAEKHLNPRQTASYQSHRRKLVTWLLDIGKTPSKAEGYAHSTAKKHLWRLDKFYRWVWQHEADGYTEDITTAHADAWMQHLAHQDYTSAYKSDCQKAVKVLFKWQSWVRDEDIEWDPAITYSESSGTDNPRDFLTRDERKRLREAVLEYDTIPAYNSLSPEERAEWKQYLAQRFSKPKEEVGKADWKRANSFKFPSLVWTSLDAGLRPVEVGRAVVSWVDAENGVLRIPKEDSSKNSDYWVVSLRDRTVEYVVKWLEERERRDRYDGRDALWLTERGNPYNRRALNYLLKQLCDIAEISYENRSVSWYSIRHSVGTYMAREEGLAAAQQQLRHKSEQTTMKYDQAPVEDRKDALERMG